MINQTVLKTKQKQNDGDGTKNSSWYSTFSDGRMRQIVFGDCTVELTPDNWNEPKTVKVKAVRDFYNDGTKRMLVDFRPIYTTYLSEFWNNYQLPPVEVRRSKQHSANTLNSEQNGRHFAGDIFTGIFLNKETLEFQIWFKFWCKK